MVFLMDTAYIQELLEQVKRNEASLTEVEPGDFENEEFVEPLALALKENTHVEGLRLMRCAISFRGAKFLKDLLLVNSTITSIELYENSLEDDGALFLAQALERNSSLRHLGAGLCGIGPDGAKHLAHALQKNSSLKSLSLEFNEFGENETESAKNFAEALKVNKVLEALDLSTSKSLSPDSLLHLAEGLKQNRSLKSLKLFEEEDSMASRSARVAFRDALLDLRKEIVTLLAANRIRGEKREKPSDPAEESSASKRAKVSEGGAASK